MPSPWKACFALGREGLTEVCGSSQMNGSMDEGVLLLFSRSAPLPRIENEIDKNDIMNHLIINVKLCRMSHMNHDCFGGDL